MHSMPRSPASVTFSSRTSQPVSKMNAGVKARKDMLSDIGDTLSACIYNSKARISKGTRMPTVCQKTKSVSGQDIASSKGSKKGIGAVDFTIAILCGDRWLNLAFRIVSPVALAKAVNRAAGNQFTRHLPFFYNPSGRLAIERSLRIRSWTGGWVLNSFATDAPVKGFTIYICAVAGLTFIGTR